MMHAATNQYVTKTSFSNFFHPRNALKAWVTGGYIVINVLAWEFDAYWSSKCPDEEDG